MPERRILIVEDDTSVADSLKQVLEGEGYQVTTVANPAESLELIRDGDFQVVVTDWNLRTPGTTGMDIIKTLHDTKPRLPAILMTGEHTTEAAIDATKYGAYDYVVKSPQLPEELLDLVQKAVANNRLTFEPVEMGETGFAKNAIVGRSRVMQDVYKQIGRVAAMPVTVLIRGETGTGKELVARAIYQHSKRANQPFIEVNCAAIPENLLESEMFGHEAGAFTDAKTRRIGRFEQADHGTIFLDEIGDMNLNIQTKFLRVLQDQRFQRLGGKEIIEVDVRVIAATHRDLELAIQEKQFREDLYYRLNDAVIKLPLLRERSEDIPELIKYFIHRYGTELGSANAAMPTQDAIACLQQQPWPGNVRQLSNVIRKALVAAGGYPISSDLVQQVLQQAAPSQPATDQTIAGYVAELLARAKRGELEAVHDVLIESVERQLYAQALALAGGDQTKAARWLGVSRPTMREKLTRFGLHPGRNSD